MHRLDPFGGRPVSANNNGINGASTPLDLQGFDYNTGNYDSWHARAPGIPAISSETSQSFAAALCNLAAPDLSARFTATENELTPYAARREAASDFSRSTRRAANTTSKPRAAAARAIELPIPADAPVMTAHGLRVGGGLEAEATATEKMKANIGDA